MKEHMYSEKDVLKMLEIDNFRQLSKEKAVKLANMGKNVKTKTLTKAAKQMPSPALIEFGSTLISTYGQAINKIMDANAEGSKVVMDACASVLEIYKEKLKSDDLTPEEEKVLVENITAIIEIMREQDKADKAFRLEALKTVGENLVKALGVVAGIAYVADKIFPLISDNAFSDDSRDDDYVIYPDDDDADND